MIHIAAMDLLTHEPTQGARALVAGRTAEEEVVAEDVKAIDEVELATTSVVVVEDGASDAEVAEARLPSFGPFFGPFPGARSLGELERASCQAGPFPAF